MQRLRSLTRKYVTNTDRSRFQQSLFHVHMRRNSIPFFEVVLGLLGLFVAGMWPTDWIFFDEPVVRKTFFVWRTIVLGSIAIFFAGLKFTNLLHRYLFVILYAGVLLVVGSTGYLFGRLPAVDAQTPWFYFVFVLPFVSIVFSVRIYRRTLATILFPVAYLLGFFSFELSITRWDTVFFGVSANLIVACIVLSVILGHMVYNLNRGNFFQSRQHKKQRREIRKLANYDHLTGLYNRRQFDSRLKEELVRARRYDKNLSVMVIDLDHFKEVNDTHGHQAGDDVLEEIGDIVRDQTRRNDLACRYGGEEFCVALIETGIGEAEELAERLREDLARRTFRANGTEFQVTCSAGIVEYENEEDYTTLLKKADQALYVAKEQGRNCVVCQER